MLTVVLDQSHVVYGQGSLTIFIVFVIFLHTKRIFSNHDINYKIFLQNVEHLLKTDHQVEDIKAIGNNTCTKKCSMISFIIIFYNYCSTFNGKTFIFIVPKNNCGFYLLLFFFIIIVVLLMERPSYLLFLRTIVVFIYYYYFL